MIVWTRFSAAKVPPDQAVNAVPQSELVAIGSALLLLFGFFGVLALAAAFLIDRNGRATPGMVRGLLFIFMLEAAVTIVIAEGVSAERTIAAVELLGLSVGLAAWVTFIGRLVKLEDDLPTLDGERPGPRPYSMFLLDDPDWPEGKAERRKLTADDWTDRLIWVPLAVAVGGIVVGGALIALDAWSILDVGESDLLIALSAFVVAFVGSAAAALIHNGRPVRQLIWKKRRAREKQEREELRRREAERSADEDLSHRLRRLASPSPKDRVVVERERRQEGLRLLNDRPMRLSLRSGGTISVLAALIPAPLLAWALVGEWWVAASIGAAAILAVGLWRIATLAAERLVWFGVAVFLSVPLFGTLTAMARNIANPQVQPMALIRESDGPTEAIQGLYVTEADDRIYFATVATEGCNKELTPHSGRLEWVPKSEVVAMSIGPLQDVDDAAGSALEMAYALTPAVETQGDSEASFAATESPQPPSEGLTVASTSAERRLEDTGPAVRPNFGAGLSLSPEDASPGDVVTLRMSAPNNDGAVRGFGQTRSGHTLRVGGVRATIVKERARTAEGAEFLQTFRGRLLKLDKSGPFVRKLDGHFVPLEEVGDAPHGNRRYLRLIDPAVRAVVDSEMPSSSRYLQLAGATSYPVLERTSRTIELAEARGESQTEQQNRTARLRVRPLGQSWHERAIRFVVPDNASTAAVSVECSQLAGQPLLRVAHAPEARISVQMRIGSNRVTFDSSRSSDGDEESISRRWNVAGLLRGNLTKMSADLPARRDPYDITLTTTDESGRTDEVELHLLRLPAALFELDEERPRNEDALSKARAALVEAMRQDPPVSIQIDGHADDTGTFRHNLDLSSRRAAYVRDELLRKLDGISDGLEVPVRTLAYGETCPLDPRAGPRTRNRRVDVFLLHQGVSMAPPAGCHPRRFESTELLLSPGPPRANSCPRRPSAERADGSNDLFGRAADALADVLGDVTGNEEKVTSPRCRPSG